MCKLLFIQVKRVTGTVVESSGFDARILDLNHRFMTDEDANRILQHDSAEKRVEAFINYLETQLGPMGRFAARRLEEFISKYEKMGFNVDVLEKQ